MSNDILKANTSSVLGKGLASLIPQHKQIEGEESVQDRVLSVSVDKIVPNPFQPRKDFKEEALRDLADSILIHGILEPLLVTRRGDEYYELVAGERRLRAAKLAKLREVPVIVKHADEKKKIAWALTENLQREDLDPIEEALAYKFLMDEYHMDSKEISGVFSHRSDSSIRNMIRLLDLPPVIQQGLKDKKIPYSTARALLALPRDDQKVAIYQLAISANLNRRAVEDKVKKILEERNVGRRFAHPNAAEMRNLFPEIVENEERLSMKLKCPAYILRYKSGRGKITFEFTTIAMMEEIIKGILS